MDGQLESAPSERPHTIGWLRRMWKPRRDSYSEAQLYEDFRIRVHRAVTWMEAAEARGATELDTQLIERWVAVEALSGQWDPVERMARSSRVTLNEFAARLLRSDVDGLLVATLTEHKPLGVSILSDKYVSRHFWNDPDGQTPRDPRKAAHAAHELWREKRWDVILNRILERIHFVRCQLLHGGATYNGRLNRNAVKRSSVMLGRLVPAMLEVLMEHGYADDWSGICYPPLPPGP